MIYSDLSGLRLGHWTILEKAPSKNRKSRWLCKCDCGKTRIVNSCHLKNGSSTSCGCTRSGNLKHGLRHTRVYGIYQHMKYRCYNPNDKHYKDYGGRGIKVCDEWRDNFQAFYDWAVSNGYQENLTLDRINVNGNYSPDNCRWATTIQQANNTRANHYITFNGERRSMSEWSRIKGIPYSTLRSRINDLHWSIEQALTMEVK